MRSAVDLAKEKYNEAMRISKSIESKTNTLMIAISFLFTGMATYIGVAINSDNKISLDLLISIICCIFTTTIFTLVTLYPSKTKNMSFELENYDKNQEVADMNLLDSELVNKYNQVAEAIINLNEKRMKLAYCRNLS